MVLPGLTRVCLAALLTGVAVAGSHGMRAGQSRFDPGRLLGSVGRFSADDLSALDRGEILAKALSTDRREIAVIGAVRIRAARDRVLDRYRDVHALRRSSVVLEVGVFGSPPRPDDLLPLSFEQYDLESVRECVPGDCAVRLGGVEMARFHSAVSWQSPDWRSQAAATWRRTLADRVAGYLQKGDRALPQYHNKETPLAVADEFRLLYEAAAPFAPIVPEPFRYVREFPHRHLEGTEDILYWSKDAFGLRPVVSVTHLSVYAPAAPTGTALVATKRLYSTHYFDAALGLTAIGPDLDGGVYLVSMSRARTRSLTSPLRAFVRSTVLSRSREALEKTLRAIKAAAERDGISPQPPLRAPVG